MGESVCGHCSLQDNSQFAGVLFFAQLSQKFVKTLFHLFKCSRGAAFQKGCFRSFNLHLNLQKAGERFFDSADKILIERIGQRPFFQKSVDVLSLPFLQEL